MHFEIESSLESVFKGGDNMVGGKKTEKLKSTYMKHNKYPICIYVAQSALILN